MLNNPFKDLLKLRLKNECSENFIFHPHCASSGSLPGVKRGAPPARLSGTIKRWARKRVHAKCSYLLTKFRSTHETQMILLTASWQPCVLCNLAPYLSLMPCQSYPLNKQSPQRYNLTVSPRNTKWTTNTLKLHWQIIHRVNRQDKTVAPVRFRYIFWLFFSALSSVLSHRRVEPSLAGEFPKADSSPLCDGGEIPPWEWSIPQVKTWEAESISTSNKASRHTHLLYYVSLCRPLIIIIFIITAPGGRKQSFYHHPGSRPSVLLYMPRLGQVGYEGHHHPHVHARSHSDGQGSQE